MKLASRWSHFDPATLLYENRACYSRVGLNPAGTSIATRGLHPGRVHSGNWVRLRWSLVRR